jgi:predicted CopG family antitoxin
MMNDPIYVEASRVLGYNMMSFDDPKASISDVFKRLTGRSIRKKELNLLFDLQSSEYEKFKSREYKTEGWLNTGEFRISKYKNKAMVAANAIVASTIINSDATIIKR